ncbi:MAG: bifunctional phosphoribosyl-AMP cyclohydrolase/phosphoribosyl-ATP diphosphatase HisIE [Lachnospiraceae bacterium]|nr:bifunctional phosphoribosyl-AMP cyclohydrolase/phosphoribosyl-ATP diphosphatase HisIE [Lachnospiraceae bacterium]
MQTKKVMPILYIKSGKAYLDKNYTEEFKANKVDAGTYYSVNDADVLILLDMDWNSDEEHDVNLVLMRDICDNSQIPVYAGGKVLRFEDTKKYLYTGAKKAVIYTDYAIRENAITESVKRFGKDSIVLCGKLEVFRNSADFFKGNASELLIFEDDEVAVEEYKEVSDILDMKIIPVVAYTVVAKLMLLLKEDFASGISGEHLSSVDTNLTAFKYACKINGLEMELLKSKMEWSDFKTNSDGMVPVIVQDYKTNDVLQLAYMNEEAFKETIASGKMTYWSRSRNELWKKGETSGHYQYVKSLTADCDKDTILAKVAQVGAACHTGKRSCFFEEIAKKEYEELNPLKVLEDVYGVIADRKVNPKEGSYTNYLFDKGIDKILKKVGEEATEIVIAAKNPEAEEIKYEIADFLYHVMVLMVERGLTWEDIIKELANR